MITQPKKLDLKRVMRLSVAAAKNKKTFVVMAGDYNDLSGGIVALHLLCHLLNVSGHHAFICNTVSASEARPTTAFGGVGSALRAWFRWHVREKRRRLRTSETLRTPVIDDVSVVRNSAQWVVVYPETIFGNPLAARNVVRWYLHHPGYFTGAVGVGRSEVHVRYSEWQRLPNVEWCHQYAKVLRPFVVPECYHLPEFNHFREGSCYCLRKGRGREVGDSFDKSLLIDNLTHAETARLLQSVKTFVSYDMYTAFSLFAVLCGADSVVVPDPGLTSEQWLRSEEERWGIAYGFDDLPRARETAHLQRERIVSMQEQSAQCVAEFASFVVDYFS